MHTNPIFIIQISISLLLIICFFQSGVDKIINRKENFNWLIGHFSNTPFRNYIRILLSIITFFEITTSLVLACGLIITIIYGSTEILYCGFQLTIITLLSLFLGQRIAKDYDGAYVLVVYFIITVLGVLSFN